MFDKQRLVSDCREALGGDRALRNLREVVERAVADPPALIAGLGEPRESRLEVLHRSPELTVLNVIWPVGAILMPHNHALRAVIGVYSGREDNLLWRRLPDDDHGRIEAAGARTLGPGDTVAFGAEVIHSVVNPVGRTTAAIHVYDGDFFGVNRSEWDPQSLHERPLDMERLLRTFGR
jgi:predicted metal-dependent enzyme (double-stranded beta helix superfamily)